MIYQKRSDPKEYRRTDFRAAFGPVEVGGYAVGVSGAIYKILLSATDREWKAEVVIEKVAGLGVVGTRTWVAKNRVMRVELVTDAKTI